MFFWEAILGLSGSAMMPDGFCNKGNVLSCGTLWSSDINLSDTSLVDLSVAAACSCISVNLYLKCSGRAHEGNLVVFLLN